MQPVKLPLIEQLQSERLSVLEILSNIEVDLARLKSFDESIMPPVQQRRHARSIANAVSAKHRATVRLQQLKPLIKAENNRLHAEQQLAAHADRVRRENEAKGQQS